MRSTKPQILLLGGNGFIGRHLESEFGAFANIISPRKSELNLLDVEEVKKALKACDPDVILHSALLPIHRNRASVPENTRDNIKMVLNVAFNKKAECRLLWVSSGAVYAHELRGHPVQEGDELKAVPQDDLGLGKLLVSIALRTIPNVLELRPFGIYGEYEDISIRIFSNLICRALLKLPIIYNHERLMTYVDVVDFARFAREAMLSRLCITGIYNVGAYDLLLSNIASMVALATNYDCPIIQRKNITSTSYVAERTRFRTRFPEVTYTNIDDSLNRLIAWYRGRIDTLQIAEVTRWDQ